VAAASGEALLAIINEVLDFAKIGAGQMRLVHEPIDVEAIVRSVATLFSAAAQNNSIELTVDADPALAPRRMGDSLHLRQVLMNLVGNAMKFAPHGRVVLGVHRLGDATSERVRFEVSDSGFGIDASQQEKIFEPFAQSDSPGQGGQGGTGLGLTISRELVHAMGGELGVVSAPGHGSTFGFDLTLASAPALLRVPQGTGAAAPVRPETARRRVLMVEDNPVNQLICTAMLESMGLEVVLAEDGGAALARLAEGSFAVVLMDCLMPVMDGYEATRRLRELERLEGRERTPVIALTANAFSGDVARCLAAGMDAHLAKPFKTEALQTVMAPWMRDAAA
jgi:CheY-like chemotaxis protein/anti-sigma regulatory factor (Ser/Thr protein kinase)